MLISGLLTAVGFVAIAAKFSKSFLKKVLGYDWLVDILATVGMMAFFASTGTISGAMTAVVTGLCISFVLWVAKNTYGYSKYDMVDGKRTWVDYHGKWTPRYLASKLKLNIADQFSGVITELKAGWNEKPVQAA